MWAFLSDSCHASSIRICRVRLSTWCSPTFGSQSLPAPHLSVASGPRWPQTPGFGTRSDSLSPSHAGIAKTWFHFIHLFNYRQLGTLTDMLACPRFSLGVKKVKFLLNSPQRPILHRLIWITVKHHLTICVPFPLEDSRLSLLAG